MKKALLVTLIVASFHTWADERADLSPILTELESYLLSAERRTAVEQISIRIETDNLLMKMGAEPLDAHERQLELEEILRANILTPMDLTLPQLADLLNLFHKDCSFYVDKGKLFVRAGLWPWAREVNVEHPHIEQQHLHDTHSNNGDHSSFPVGIGYYPGNFKIGARDVDAEISFEHFDAEGWHLDQVGWISEVRPADGTHLIFCHSKSKVNFHK